ncbi:MAG: 50S ribosomal protein L24e [Candidatus Bathyarchaeia archaeon]|nr:50S ribosomal protein L24e [Candidatus Bathyarchaeota archaeon]
MPRTFKCSFCGKEYPPASGIAYFRNDGSILYFCSTKCRKNLLKLGRDPRKLKWTKHFSRKES